MANGISGEVSCYQCGLPVTSSRRKQKIGDIDESFCCAGCLLVYKITGTKGEEGLSQALLGKFGIGLLLTMNVMMLSLPLRGGEYASIIVPDKFAEPIRYIMLLFSIPVILLLGYPIVRSSYISIKSRVIATEALILIGAVSAFAISVQATLTGTGQIYYETATMILTLFTLGRYIDSRARWKASESIKGLSSMLPDKVMLKRDDGSTEMISSDMVSPGNIVILRPGERIPLDGVVINGTGSVDESFLTGESKPVVKNVDMEVFSGSINIDGNFTVEIRKHREEFVVKKIERLMESIRKNPSHIKRIGDRIAAYLAPGAVAIAIGSLFYWISKGDTSTAIMRMLSILLISCPCAFGIAAPLAIWRGLGVAAGRGVIIMGADVLEGLSKIKTVFFDKTGTLTSHALALSKIHPGIGRSEDEILTVAASLEFHSTHPLAISMVKEAGEKGLKLSDVTDIKTHPGQGIEGIANERRYFLGSLSWVESMDIALGDDIIKHIKTTGDQGTIVLLVEEREVIGFFHFTQSLRAGAVETFDTLKRMGIKTGILTGDDEKGAMEIKEKLMADEIKWRLMPADKAKEIDKRKKGQMVAMVGDGINDAPALEAAHIGIAMGCGTELTRESAKVNLLGDDLQLIPYLIYLSRQVRKKVYTNFFWASIYNLIGVYLAIIGKISPLFAVIAMLLSSLFVIGNSRRL